MFMLLRNGNKSARKDYHHSWSTPNCVNLNTLTNWNSDGNSNRNYFVRLNTLNLWLSIPLNDVQTVVISHVGVYEY